MTCCGLATAMSQGSSRVPPPSSDQQVNTGTVPGPPRGHAASVERGLGTPSADRSGMGRSRRSSRRSHDRRGGRESRSQGEGRQWFREVSRRDWRLQCRKTRRRMVTPRPRAKHRRCAGGAAAAGIGDAGQASPLGGGRSWPPVRRPVQPRARPGHADRGVGPGREQPRGQDRRFGRVDCHPDRGRGRGHAVPGRPPDADQVRRVSTATGAGTQDPQAGRVGQGAAPGDSRRWPTGSSRRR